jgi:molybdopterin molybdotransferase
VTGRSWSVERYADRLVGSIVPLGTEAVPLVEAFGRVVAKPIRAVLPVPLFDNSAMDGFAVCAQDLDDATPGAPVRLQVVGRQPAGAVPDRRLDRGEAVRIMTGAPLPDGADRVVPVEATVSGRFDDDPFVEVRPGSKSNVRRAGEDIQAGTGLARRRPRVANISTGDEVAPAPSFATDATARIPDSNAAYLSAAVASVGAETCIRLAATDDVADLESVLDRAAQVADLIISTGGLGAGSHDFVRSVIVDGCGADGAGVVASVSMKPGRPQAHGTWRGVPWVALPGNTTAAFVSFEMFVRPVIDRLAGRGASAKEGSHVLDEAWSAPAGTVRFVPLSFGDEATSPGATIVGSLHAAHSLSAMFTSPLIGVIGSDVGRLDRGDVIRSLAPA